MLASESRGYTALFTLEAEHGEKYGLDSEYDGLEPLFNDLENGEQIDNCHPHCTALNPYLERTLMAEVFQFSGQDVKQGEHDLNTTQHVYKVLRDLSRWRAPKGHGSAVDAAAESF